jgi:branched-chain amino acid aminotransferase
MKKNLIIYQNHRWLSLKSARISPLDRGFLYGDGVFETLRSYQGRIFKLEDHLQRLFQSARLISLRMPKEAKEIKAILYKTLSKNRIEDGMIRLTCSRGPGEIGLDPSFALRPTFIVMAFPFDPPSELVYKKGVSIRIVKTRKNFSQAVPTGAKSSNFLNNILAKIEAKKEGADEAILLNDRGYITEGSVSNLFFFKEGTLFTPSLNSGILEGVTRETVIDLAKSDQIRVSEKRIKPESLHAADECFITSTGYEIMPATQLNGKKVGNGTPGPMTQRLMALFKKTVSRLE